MCGKCADCRLHTCVAPDLRHGDPNRRPVSRALECDGTTHGSHHEIVAQQLGMWTVVAECRYAYVHDPRIERARLGVVHTVICQCPPRLQYEVGTRNERTQRRHVIVVCRIERDRAFVAVERQELQARKVIGRTVQPRAARPSRRSSRSFDLDDVCPEIPQHHWADLATLVGQIEHRVAVEHRSLLKCVAFVLPACRARRPPASHYSS